MSPYVLDSDVFIAAKNSYYAFAICPGFWDSLLHHHDTGVVHSIDKVKDELLVGYKAEKKREEEGKGEVEDLKKWIITKLPSDFFLGTNEEAVPASYKSVMLWVHRNTQYTDPAKAKFATEADGWLVAFAMVHDVTVITNEQSRPESRSRILLPDVCMQFDVTYKNTFLMLHELAVSFNYME